MIWLDKYRKKVDLCDKKLLAALSKRMKLSKAIGKLKREKGLPISDGARELNLMKKRIIDGKRLGLDKKFVKKVFKELLFESKKIQKKA